MRILHFRLFIALLLSLSGLLSWKANAQTDPIAAPTLRWHAPGETSRDAAALDLDVRYAVTGLVAEAVVTQHFRNESSLFLEGQYLLPLPDGAAVYSLRLKIGDRLVEGEIRERAQAQAEYQAAAAAGQRASLLEQQQANVFRTAVANVAPGETVEIQVGYWQRVRFQDGRFSLTFPLTFVPRYAQTTPAPESAMAATGQPAQLDAPLLAAPKVDIVVSLAPGLPVQSVHSDTHAVQVDATPHGYLVSLRGDRVPADRDFILNWYPQPNTAPEAGLLVEQAQGETYALVMVVPPTQKAERLDRELILVIDTSGSMLGKSMEQARAAVDTALAHLGPQDRFNVIRFSSETELLFPEPQPAQPEAVAEARDWVASLQAEGGTEMLPALQAALRGQAPTGMVRQVVFATDGAVSQEQELYRLIERELGASRLFPIGIGDAPNAYFLKQAALMGRGASLTIRDTQEVAERMQALFTKLDSPTLRDIKVQWPTGSEPYPERVPDLYQGEPLMLVAKLPTTAGAVSAHGALKQQAWARSLALSAQPSRPGIARLWAQANIEHWQGRLQLGLIDAEQARAHIVPVALHHHLVTPYTSLVAVDRTPVRSAQDPMRSTWVANGADDALAYAATATLAPLGTWIGVLGLALLLLYRYPRRAAGGRHVAP